MPADIRSFFKPKSAPKETPKKSVPNLSDEDEIPESPDVSVKVKKKESRKKRVLSDSSDEEIFTKKPKTTQNKEKKTKSISKPDKPIKEVKVSDMFGSGPIKRTEPLVKKSQKKTEIGIHSDEEFENSLLALDAQEISNNNQDSKSPQKIVSINKDKSPKVDKSIKNQESQRSKTPSKKDMIKKENVKEINVDTDTNRPKKENLLKSPSKHKMKENIEKKPSKDMKVQNDIEKPQTSIEVDSKSLKLKETIDKKSSNTEKETKLEHGKDKPKANIIIEINSDSDSSVSKSKSKPDKKRDFSDFIQDSDEVQDDETPNKKKKFNKSLNSSVLSDEERHERKRHSAILYQNYKNRSGPKHLGAKVMPEGTPDCLKDCAFLLTGVLDSFERDEVADAITKYGGCIKSGISKKVTHVLAGDEAGPAKLAKAQDLGIKILNEDEFLQMIIDRSNPDKKGGKVGKSPKNDKKDKVPQDDRSSQKLKSPKESKDKIKEKSPKTKSTNETSKSKVKADPEQMKSLEERVKSSFYSNKVNGDTKKENTVEVKKEVSNTEASSSTKSNTSTIPSIMWVDKYKPQNIKQIIGQHGDASNVKKLMNWLTKWYISRKEKTSKPSPWAKNDDGAFFKAALLSGPPGIGKTTTVALVCKELGFDTVEFNASDTRSKNLIKEQIGQLLNTTSLAGFSKGEINKKALSKKHVLVMDEVDGMAGNEDRGGLQELISLIKSTSVPIICMCNDRNSEKMRTLVNYCFDLKFSRPRVDQIKSAMLSICFKEGIKVPPDVLTQLIISSNQDIRQTLNSLSMWAADPNNMGTDSLKKDASTTRKDLKLGPWEAVRKVFSAEDHKTMSIHDKSNLFFYDYSIAPLFVQENYLSVTPHCDKKEILHRMSKAADNISLGDLVDARIRGSQAWSLLPVQAMYSSVLPGSAMNGHVSGQIQFPSWLGKNSRTNKMKRMAQEIHAHTRLSTSGSKSSIHLDYSRYLRDAILGPLITDKAAGVDRAVQVLQDYHLLREDLDSLVELSLWPGQRDPMVLVDSKVKASMTRTYNKLSPALPHAGASFSKSRRNKDEDQGEGDDGELETGDSEPENDGLIKVKKRSAAKTSEEKPSTSKEKKKGGKKK